MNLLYLKSQFEDAIINKYISTPLKHPIFDYYIYNYSQHAQFERVWNEATMLSRGLVMDKDYNIILRPFKKFFNMEELNGNYPKNESFEVYDKMDGSLFIVGVDSFRNLICCTRGSFQSEQAQVGYEILMNKYSNLIDKLLIGKTYLFEVIYPENRIVLSYDGMKDIVLLTIVDNETGLDSLDGNVGFNAVKKIDCITDLESIKEKYQTESDEGFVIKFIPSCFRMKVKFDEYVRLHRILTQVSTKDIWKTLRDGKSVNQMIEKVPDEFFSWVSEEVSKLTSKYLEIESSAKEEYEIIKIDLGELFSNRKEFALKASQSKYRSILFAFYLGKSYTQTIWNMIEPEYQKPFKQNNLDEN